MDSNKSSVLGWVAIVIAIIACAGVFLSGGSGPNAGGTGTRYPDGLSADTTSPVAGQVRGTTAAFTSTSAFSGLMTLNAGSLRTYTSATTTTGNDVFGLSDLTGYDTIIVTPTIGSMTLTLPASSTVPTWLPSAGNSQKTCFVNGTTTTGIVITMAGGTGTNLLVASSTATALGSTLLFPKKMACIDFVRGNSTATTFDINAAMTMFQ